MPNNILVTTDSFKRFVADRLRLSATHVLPRDECAMLNGAELVQRLDGVRDRLVFDLISGVHAMPKERIVVDEVVFTTWWDHFKQRWFPDWALTRWPAKCKEIHIDKQIYGPVCPHQQCEPGKKHLHWMMAD